VPTVNDQVVPVVSVRTEENKKEEEPELLPEISHDEIFL
jgi:hypothetical protein